MPAYPRYPTGDDPLARPDRPFAPRDDDNPDDQAPTQLWSPPPRFQPDYSFAHDSDTAEQRLAARRSADANSVFASGVWAEDEPEEPATEVRPAAALPPVASRAAGPAAHRTKPRRTGLWIGLGAALVVIVAVALVLWLVVAPLKQAKSDFAAAQPGLAQARTTLRTAVDTTQATVGAIQGADMADPSLLDQYTGLLDQAQTSLATPDPVMATQASAIRQQVDQMTTLTSTMNGQAANLARLSAAVVISRDKATYQKAQANLTAAVAAAQSVYDSSDGNVTDETLRTTLKSQIDAANQLIGASVADADLPTATDQLNAAATALAAADQAVISNQRAAGGKTYTYTLLASAGQINAAQMPMDAVILAMKIYVTGSLVQVQTCYQQAGVADLATCDGYFNGSFFDMTGSRQGTTAVVQDVDPNALYLWGTLTFASSAVTAKVVSFDGPVALCQLPDGTIFGDPTLPSCGNIAV